MLRKISLATSFIVLAAAPCLCQEWASKMFKITEHNFGTVARGSKAEFDFRLSNLYRDDVHIVNAYSSCGCTSVSLIRPTLKAWEEGAVHAVFNTPSFTGSRAATITVIIDKPMPAEVLLHVRGVIRGDVVFEPGSIQLGDVDQGTAVEKNIRVSRYGGSDWQVTGINSSNPSLSAKVLSASRQDGWTMANLLVRLDKNAPIGYIQDHLTLMTSEGQSVQMPLEVEGRVVSNLSVSPSSLFMGLVQPGKTVTKPLVVKGNRPFKIISVTCEDKSFKFAAIGSDSNLVHIIPVTFVAGTAENKVRKSVHIMTDLGQTTAEVSAHTVISSETAVNDK